MKDSLNTIEKDIKQKSRNEAVNEKESDQEFESPKRDSHQNSLYNE